MKMMCIEGSLKACGGKKEPRDSENKMGRGALEVIWARRKGAGQGGSQR